MISFLKLLCVCFVGSAIISCYTSSACSIAFLPDASISSPTPTANPNHILVRISEQNSQGQTIRAKKAIVDIATHTLSSPKDSDAPLLPAPINVLPSNYNGTFSNTSFSLAFPNGSVVFQIDLPNRALDTFSLERTLFFVAEDVNACFVLYQQENSSNNMTGTKFDQLFPIKSFPCFSYISLWSSFRLIAEWFNHFHIQYRG